MNTRKGRDRRAVSWSITTNAYAKGVFINAITVMSINIVIPRGKADPNSRPCIKVKRPMTWPRKPGWIVVWVFVGVGVKSIRDRVRVVTVVGRGGGRQRVRDGERSF